LNESPLLIASLAATHKIKFIDTQITLTGSTGEIMLFEVGGATGSSIVFKNFTLIDTFSEAGSTLFAPLDPASNVEYILDGNVNLYFNGDYIINTGSSESDVYLTLNGK